MKAIKSLIFLCVTGVLAACGGGGSPQAGSTHIETSHTATLKLATSGTPSAQLAGIGITITLPAGVTPLLDADGTVSAAGATVSGVAVPGRVLPPVYTHVDGKGRLRLVMASGKATGFGSGEFATVTVVEAAGSNATASDFILSSFNPIDVNGSSATGLTAVVSNLSNQ